MLINGINLTAAQADQVKAAFVNRLTREMKAAKLLPSKVLATYPSDNQWIMRHAFHFIKNGSRLCANRRHAEPAFMAD